ncbi:MAG TPA: hypothetical protein VEI82_05365 [Myxococcota bacterium]|nr:hypothetical protein [Myxococcota bacterium]
MNHRAVQRALFRMQLDPRFAERVAAREPEAVRSAGLGPDELALLAGADRIALSADREGRRRAQFLRNVAGEFALSLAAAARAELVDEFPASPEFHAAVTAGDSLPLAFARHLAARTAQAPALVRALVSLEVALARLRRAVGAAPELAPGEVARAPWVELLAVPAGTLAAAAALRSALDRGATPGRVDVSATALETLLLRRTPEPAPFRLPAVELEALSPALADLLARAAKPLGRAARADYARAVEIAPAELEQVVAGLVADRVLLAG